MYFGVSRGRSNAPKAVPGTNIEPTPLADDTNDTMSSVQRTEMEPMDMGTSTEISCAAGDQNSEIISITLRGPQSPPPICDLSHEVQQIRNDSTDMRHELEGFRHELKDFRNELKDNQDHLKAYLDLWGKTLLSHISYKVGSR
ncbi:hypothetical protein BKA69DRAFT_1039602 [Paraphysoderma sedebokerense]|nr:hypothetical protein BKA69DRAFT_1039602 [Paraphysoderma sedebokerense]